MLSPPMSLLAHRLPGRIQEREKYYTHSVRMENLNDCTNGYPRDLVLDPDDQSISQDALRCELWRCNLCRNCPVMNSHSPVVALGLQSNSDAQPVVTRNQAEMYCCKYVTKHGKRLGSRCALMDVVDDMEAKDSHAKDAFGESFEEAKLGGKMHKVFMAEIGEEMSQSELAHHANRSSLHHFLCPHLAQIPL